MLDWFNPTSEYCPRHTDLTHNGEMFCNRPNCCGTDYPSPEEDDIHMVHIWEQRRIKPRMTGLRSDGTFHVLEKTMKESLIHMFDCWRHQKWASIRGEQIELPCDIFLPRHLMLHIADKAHLATSLDRLKVLCEDWEYLDSHGPELLIFLSKIMHSFNALFDARKDPDVPKPSAVLTSKPLTAPRLILGPAPRAPLETLKRPPPSPQKPRPVPRKRMCMPENKENDPDAIFIISRKRKLSSS